MSEDPFYVRNILEHGTPVEHYLQLEKDALNRRRLLDIEEESRGFADICRAISSPDSGGTCAGLLKFVEHNPSFGRSREAIETLGLIKGHTLLNDVWGTSSGKRIADYYLASVRNQDLLGSLLTYGKNIPEDLGHVVAVSGAIASNVNEGQLKPLVRSTLSGHTLPVYKSAGLAAVSKELMLATQNEARTLFENELQNAVVAGTNETLLTIPTPTPVAADSSGDIVADLENALAALPNSNNVIVATTTGNCRKLSIRSQNNMGINGGEFVPGVHIVPAIEDSSSAPVLVAYAADRIAVADVEFNVRRANEASINMADSPESPGELVSLWQTNMLGVMVERFFKVHFESDSVVEVQ